ncbi:MAG TPA: BatD family protein [Thermoanaerobaculia bacterium]|nr:BatD family protein [Thermoanaerobaculia bacterium]
MGSEDRLNHLAASSTGPVILSEGGGEGVSEGSAIGHSLRTQILRSRPPVPLAQDDGAWWRTRPIFVLIALIAATLQAEESSLTVRPRVVQLGDPIEIQVQLEGSFARIDTFDIPADGVRLRGSPSVSSEYYWIGRRASRRKTFRYHATASRAGTARVGPIMISDREGKQLVLPAVEIEVRAEIEGLSSPSEIGADIERAARERIFIFAEATPMRPWEGQQVMVTWYLYTAEPVQDLELGEKPLLEDFWTEELPVESRRSSEVEIGGRRYRKIPIRRVALFPLRSGRLTIGQFEIIAHVVEPLPDVFGGFSRFEGRLTRIRRRSSAMQIDVVPMPAGRAVDAVGTFRLSCGQPVVGADGPLSIDVTVSGSGNLRAAAAPRFVAPVDANVDVEENEMLVDREASAVIMNRSWRFLLFPHGSGELRIPSIELVTFDPASGGRRTLTCGESTAFVRKADPLQVAATDVVQAADPPAWWRTFDRETIAVAGSAMLLVVLLLVIGRRRSRFDRKELQSLLSIDDPVELRRSIHEAVARRGIVATTLLTERSELGDAFRSVSSWIEIRSKEMLTGDASCRDLRKRLAELLSRLDSDGRGDS